MIAQLCGGLLGIVILAGLAIGLKWMMSAMSATRTAESLSPEDLRVLEEAAARLVDDIKQTAAVAVRDLDERCEKLRALTIQADQRLALLAESALRPEVVEPLGAEQDARERIYSMADGGLTADDIARRENMPAGEVTLLLGLRPCVPSEAAD